MLLKLIVILLIILFTGFPIHAQSLFNGCESVAFDSLNNRYLATSLFSGRIIAIDEYGIQSVYASSLGFTYGNCIKDNILYVSTGGSPSIIRGFDLSTDEQIMAVTIPASVQCDGMTTDTSGNLFIVDARNESLIWKIDLETETYSVFQNMHLANYTQDIFFDAANNRLLVVAWSLNTPIKAISIPDAVVTDVVSSFGSFDGITMDDEGNTYVATHANGGCVYKYDVSFTDPPELIATGFSEPAGLDYNVRDRILAVPEFSGDKVTFVQQDIAVDFDTNLGWVPLDINFEGWAEEEISSWSWDFGDGEISTEQSPTHTYTTPGYYDVSLEAITTTDDTLYRTRKGVIGCLADTLIGNSVEVQPGEVVEYSITLNNNTPIWTITIPIVYAGDLDLVYDSFSTEGCRTDYFETKETIHTDTWVKKLTIKLTKIPGNSLPALMPGDGPVLKLFFTAPAGDVYSMSTPVMIDGYNSYLPGYTGSMIDLTLPVVNGDVTVPECCIKRGDVADPVDGNVFVDDLSFLVDYLFKGGLAPACPKAGDCAMPVDGNIFVDDLTYLVDYLFKGGTEPPEC